jgi:hypothetical protein
MKIKYQLAGLVAIVLGFFSGSSLLPGFLSDREFQKFQKGIAFTGYGREAYVSPAARLSLRHLKQTRASWISLLVTGYQDNIDSTYIDYSGALTPEDESLTGLIAYARQLGLKVMLKPHLDLLNDPEHWRGQIGQNFDEFSWQLWFSSYRDFILHYARLASLAGAEEFCLGCELDNTLKRSEDWLATIASVREVYKGQLVYADDQLETRPEAVTFWGALDFIGQDLYSTLSHKLQPSVSDLCAGWSRILPRLEAISTKWGKPVLITEIGYRSIKGGTINPWDFEKTGPVDLRVQRNGYEAALRMVRGRSYLKGMFWWQWFPDPAIGGGTDTSYTPYRKPAQLVLALFYLFPL